MGQEAGSSVYDEMHAAEDLKLPVKRSFYYRLFCAVVREVANRSIENVIEVGCGTGTLAQLLIARCGVGYRGFDFSEEAVRRARLRLGRPGTVFVGDALDADCYQSPYDGIVCTEVLEHIERDVDVIAHWRCGTQCVCSVPNFDYPTHVRHFRHEDEIRTRYGRLIDIDSIIRIPRPIFVGVTPREYLRKLRWARGEPTRVLGMLGIKTFDWYAGWFVFAGTRRF